jgi:2-polyprenyl-3-methyl-5-hydroxy-6-metoxy-1,4-benzoquinol methylase
MIKVIEKKVRKSVLERYDAQVETVADPYSRQVVHYGQAGIQEHHYACLFDLYGSFSGKRILDIGCGVGHFYEYLLAKGVKDFEYLGIDVSPKMIELAARKHTRAKFKVVLWPFEAHKIDGEEVDVAVLVRVFGSMWHVLSPAEQYALTCYFIEEVMERVKECFVFQMNPARKGVLSFLPKGYDTGWDCEIDDTLGSGGCYVRLDWRKK